MPTTRAHDPVPDPRHDRLPEVFLRRGERLYWRDDTHWNEAGLRVAAEELARKLEPLLP